MNIQINSGVNSIGASLAQSLAGPGPALSDAFRAELASVLESTLEKYGINPGGITISVNPASSTGQPRQNSVTGSIAASIAAAPNSITHPAPAAAPAASAPAPAPPEQSLSFDDAYWASQPAAVQNLRNVGDPDRRSQLANQLMAQGYDIDVPIMMWGWDPQKVTDLRQSFGYTWVPSAGQAPLDVAPGVNVPGLASYDPKHAPAHAIQVA